MEISTLFQAVSVPFSLQMIMLHNDPVNTWNPLKWNTFLFTHKLKYWLNTHVYLTFSSAKENPRLPALRMWNKENSKTTKSGLDYL